jgi:hypothetical protein
MPFRKTLSLSAAFSSVVYLVAACSGAEPSQLTSSGGGSSGMSNSSSGSMTSGGMPDTDDASLPPPKPDATVTDASVALDASTTMDASVVAPDAGDQDKNRVQCGDTATSTGTGMYCATGVTCCATHPLTSPTYDAFTCGGACVGATAMKLNCDDQNDCMGGQVCCARYTAAGNGGLKIYTQNTCMAASDCSIASSTSGGTPFCDLAGIAGECKGARTCKKDAIFVGYGTCQL